MILLLHVVQGRPAGKAFRFPPGQYFLGRGPECHVRFNTDWVSRQHCQVRVTADAVFLRDLGSLNGTLVNGKLLSSEVQLVEGDLLQIGPVMLRVRLRPESEADEQLPVLPPPPSRGEILQSSDEESTEGDEPPTDMTARHPFRSDEIEENK